MNKKKYIGIAIITLFCACAIFSGGVALHQYNDSKNSMVAFDELSDLIADTEILDNIAPDANETDTTVDERVLAYEKYGALYEQNNDFIGWISIGRTNINYPVM